MRGLAATRSSVMRVKRDILSRSSVGVIVTERSRRAGERRQLGRWCRSPLALFRNVEAVTYYARSRTPGRSGDAESYRGRFFFNGDKYGLDVDHLKVGERFQSRNRIPGAVAISAARTCWPLQPAAEPSRHAAADVGGALRQHCGGDRRRVQTRTATGTFRAEFRSGDVHFSNGRTERRSPRRSFHSRAAWSSSRAPTCTRRARFLPGCNPAPGERDVYGDDRRLLRRRSDHRGLQRPRRDHETARCRTARVVHAPRAGRSGSSGPSWSSLRTTYGMTARMFVPALLQYNSAARNVGLNTRLRWEYAPGSDLFFVYSEGHDTAFSGFRGQSNRQVVVKFTRLFRF